MTRVKQTARLLTDAIARQTAFPPVPMPVRSDFIPTPEQKRRADAEWEAMDDHGNLPDGWEYEG